MSKVKKYSEFISEDMNLTPSGGNYILFNEPNYGRPQSKPSLNREDTDLIEGIDGKIYSYNDYQDMYNDYLKSGHPILKDGFNKENLDIIIGTLK